MNISICERQAIFTPPLTDADAGDSRHATSHLPSAAAHDDVLRYLCLPSLHCSSLMVVGMGGENPEGAGLRGS